MSLSDTAIVRAPHVTVVSRPAFADPAHRSVEWKGESTAAERLVEYAERLRTGSHNNPAGRETREFLRGISSKTGHSTLEHASFSLLVEGISRGLAHELQLHGSAFALAELSQRHVDADDARFVVPPAMLGSADLESRWQSQMSDALRSYTTLVDELMTRYAWVGDKMQRRRMARDAAMSVLPNSTEAKLVLTGSAAAWRTLLAQLGHEQCELEGRRLSSCILRALVPEAPAFFHDFESFVANDRHEALRVAPR